MVEAVVVVVAIELAVPDFVEIVVDATVVESGITTSVVAATLDILI